MSHAIERYLEISVLIQKKTKKKQAYLKEYWIQPELCCFPIGCTSVRHFFMAYGLWLLLHLYLHQQKKQPIMPGYVVFLSIWELVPSGIALMPSSHHQLFTRSWQLVNPHCSLLDHEESSMSHNGEISFLQPLLQCPQQISTSPYSWFFLETYVVWLHHSRDGTPCLRPRTSAVKQTFHESNTSETAFMLMPIKLLSMMQPSTNTGRRFETL